MKKQYLLKNHLFQKEKGYSIKLIFKRKLSNCAYMFCECSNIIDIDFSRFNKENITYMFYMFAQCSLFKSLDLKLFNTKNVTDMGVCSIVVLL